MIDKVMSRLFVVLCVLLFAELPVFVDLYQIRLEGHLAESKRQIDAFQTAAVAGGKSLSDYILKFLEQTDADFNAQGHLMQEALERNNFLKSACEALQRAHPLLKPVVFIRYIDNQVLADAWKTFSPGLFLSESVVIWALIGGAVGIGCILAVKGLFSLRRCKEQNR